MVEGAPSNRVPSLADVDKDELYKLDSRSFGPRTWICLGSLGKGAFGTVRLVIHR